MEKGKKQAVLDTIEDCVRELSWMHHSSDSTLTRKSLQELIDRAMSAKLQLEIEWEI